ncbi:DUF2914 domain-containing protein [soil metagenome]
MDERDKGLSSKGLPPDGATHAEMLDASPLDVTSPGVDPAGAPATGFRGFIHRHETKLDVAFFIGGFIFDMLLIEAPDHIGGVIQQAVYLVAIAALIHFEMLYRLRKWRPGKWVKKVWTWRNLALHFFLGTLLNLYSLFYIKSASLFSSLIFLVLMIGFILANELPIVKKAKVSAKVGLYSICLFSFFSIMFPIAFGFVGWIPFAFAVAMTLLVFGGQVKLLSRSIVDRMLLSRAMLAPVVSVMAAFVVFYALGWIPPVPLSVREQGIYHLIEKKGDKVELSFEKSWWKFWQTSDTDFRAEVGDKIYFFAQIYSPTRISDQVAIHWLQKDAKGNWKSSDRIPMSVHGGRHEGFRGFAFKGNYTPGEWQVRVETSSGIEISRLYFDVVSAETTGPRVYTIIER